MLVINLIVLDQAVDETNKLKNRMEIEAVGGY